MLKNNLYRLRSRVTKSKLKKQSGPSKLFIPIILLLLVISAVFFFSLVGLATNSGQATDPVSTGEFTQPIAFSHKTHIEKGEVPCEFCHIYARRSINSGAPPMAVCFGCHRVIPGSDDDPQKAKINQDAIKKLLEFKPKKESILWKKIHDLPDFVHFSHKRHIQADFDCTECHGDIDKHDVLSIDTMISDLSMGWCMKCHKEGRPALNGKIAGPVRETRGGKIVKEAGAMPPDEILLGSKDCYICHK